MRALKTHRAENILSTVEKHAVCQIIIEKIEREIFVFIIPNELLALLHTHTHTPQLDSNNTL